MPEPSLFLDSSALFAGVASATGAARALLMLGEGRIITITISEQVVVETERAVARKVPAALSYCRSAIRNANVKIIRNPTREELQEHTDIISHPADVPIVVAAIIAQVDFLVTLNRKHFIDNPEVAIRSGLPIGTPGDALAWVRDHLGSTG